MGTEQQNWSQAVNDMGDRIERRMELMETRINVRFDQQDVKIDKHIAKFETHDTNDHKFQADATASFADINTKLSNAQAVQETKDNVKKTNWDRIMSVGSTVIAIFAVLAVWFHK